MEESCVWKKVVCGRNIYMKEIKSRDLALVKLHRRS